MPIVPDYDPGFIDRYIANWNQKGYDIDDNSLAPRTKGCPFRVDIYAYKEGSRDYKFVMSMLEDIVDIMNAETPKEKYEVKELVKKVHTREDLPLYEEIEILKFNVSEVHTNEVKTVEAALYDDGYSAYFDLKEWRFKPGSPQTPPEIPYPRSPSPESSPEPEGPTISMDNLYKRGDDDLYFIR